MVFHRPAPVHSGRTALPKYFLYRRPPGPEKPRRLRSGCEQAGWPVTCKRERERERQVGGERERSAGRIPRVPISPLSPVQYFGRRLAGCPPSDTSLAHRVGILRGLPSGYGIRSCLMWTESQLYTYCILIHLFVERAMYSWIGTYLPVPGRPRGTRSGAWRPTFRKWPAPFGFDLSPVGLLNRDRGYRQPYLAAHSPLLGFMLQDLRNEEQAGKQTSSPLGRVCTTPAWGRERSSYAGEIKQAPLGSPWSLQIGPT